jgi:2-C-methyl-D-erythritol 2,4-cyclodiphosphate synthase
VSFVEDICSTLAEDLGVRRDQISVKGKTKEGLDASGAGEAVEAYAVALVGKIEN